MNQGLLCCPTSAILMFLSLYLLQGKLNDPKIISESHLIFFPNNNMIYVGAIAALLCIYSKRKGQ